MSRVCHSGLDGAPGRPANQYAGRFTARRRRQPDRHTGRLHAPGYRGSFAPTISRKPPGRGRTVLQPKVADRGARSERHRAALDHDEFIRRRLNLEGLEPLKPSFEIIGPDGASMPPRCWVYSHIRRIHHVHARQQLQDRGRRRDVDRLRRPGPRAGPLTRRAVSPRRPAFGPTIMLTGPRRHS